MSADEVARLRALADRLRALPLADVPGALTFTPASGDGLSGDHRPSRPLTSGSIAGTRAALDAGETTALALTDEALERAERHADHGVFVHVLAESARAEAARADRCAARGPLHGVPVTVKNNIHVAGVPTTCGSPVFAGRVATTDAAVVTRLRNAGAVIVGTTNLHEMAFGSTSVNPYTGTVRNPRAPEYVAGGSSGGSAAAVALGIGFASLGTDAAGSVRMPASCCGVVGFKPTHGVVSLRGVVPTSMSHVDHVGPLCTSVADARLLLDVLAGHDRDDPHSDPRPLVAADPVTDLDDVVVGVPQEYFWTGLDDDVERVCRAAVARLTDAGAQVRPVVCDIGALMPLQAVAMFVEAHVVHAEHLRATPELYSPGLRDRLLAGGSVLAQDYVRALRARRLVVDAITAALVGVDALAMPTMPVPPMRVADADADPRVALMARHTSPFNQSGHPVVSLPAGATPGGLPVGLQLVGHPFADLRLLAIAEAAETALSRAVPASPSRSRPSGRS
ncbi:amidase [Pseudonocardia sp. N23]|uniref:amidase n=1 Tax=Pseudonocardia sp. N23 TaxID=1987376 RepID=UPI000BFEA3BC|nr:amidase [Pseudonocardia sp. N23]GAY10441.1 aspartyl-tRNA(Asn) amidotransferase subunit A [Pseudonocardia sp. N23]